jgi:transposase
MDPVRPQTPSPPSSPAPSRSSESPEQRTLRHSYSTRDKRLAAITLHQAGISQREIADQLDMTRSKVRYAIQNPPTPRKRSGRPSLLSEEEIDRIEAFICCSKTNRRLGWEAIPTTMNLPYSYYAIRRALQKRGYYRRVARRKPPISEPNRLARLEWAQKHIEWTAEQWNSVLWTDETWANGGRHTKTWVTRKKGEELDPTCIMTKTQRRGGWLFWGCFHGTTKGPTLIWEKDWGTINGESYRQKIVPLIGGWIALRQRENQELILMQDNAPSHAAQETYDDFEERGILVMEWPAYSPDLNPIESVWNWIKDWIQNNRGDDISGYDAIREALNAAWAALPADFLDGLIQEMPMRCQAVIDANGMHTKY